MMEKPITYKALTEILESFTREEMLMDLKFKVMFCDKNHDRIVRDLQNVSATVTANRIALDEVTKDDAEKDGVTALIIFYEFSEQKYANLQGRFKKLTPDDAPPVSLEQAQIQGPRKKAKL